MWRVSVNGEGLMDKLQDEYYWREEEDDDYDSSEKEKTIIKYIDCENGMMMSKGNGNGGWVKMMKNAGKKLVMTGVVISSAPVLLPPLLVVSALGLAMSVPFGVAFAAFACTHKLITNLLPPPPPPLALPYYDYDYDEDDHHLDLQDPDINYYSLEQRQEEDDDDDDDDEQVENAEDVDEAEIVNGRRFIELVDDDEPETETESNNLITITDHVDRDDLEREEDHLQEEEDDDEGEINDAKLINEEEGRSRSENENNNITIDVEEKSVEAKQGDGGLTLMNDNGDNKKKTGADMVGASRGEDEDKPKVELKKEEKHLKKEGKLDHSNDLQQEKEKEWEKKINAIRVIVGFKAPRRTSYFEEVKALYLFTGIEPPTSSSSSDRQNAAAELDAKLNFLMSVIGLK